MHRASGDYAAVQWWPYCSVLWVWQARPQGAADWALWRGRCLCAAAERRERAPLPCTRCWNRVSAGWCIVSQDGCSMPELPSACLGCCRCSWVP